MSMVKLHHSDLMTACCAAYNMQYASGLDFISIILEKTCALGTRHLGLSPLI